MTRILIRGARQVITLRGAPSPRRGSDLRKLQIVDNGSVLIENGKILAVGTARRVENLEAAKGAREITAYGRVVMPGFVDCSSQLVSGPRRTTAGLASDLKSTRETAINTLAATAKATALRCLQYGTVAIEAKSGSGLDEASELKLLRTIPHLTKQLPLEIISTFFGASTIPPDRRDNPDAYVDELVHKWIPLFHQKHLASYIAISCDPSTFSAAQCHRLLSAASRLAWPVKVHTGITAASDGVRLAVEHDALAVEQLHYLTDRDISLLATSDVVAVIMPSFRYHDAAVRLPRAPELISSGAALAIASGYDRNKSPVFSMPMAIAAACRDLRMTPEEAVTASTLNAAHAIGRGHKTGSIEAGKDANLLILETSDYRDLAYESGINPVHLTMIRGEVVCRNTASYLDSFLDDTDWKRRAG